MNLQRLRGDGKVVGLAQHHHESIEAKREKTYLKRQPQDDMLTVKVCHCAIG